MPIKVKHYAAKTISANNSLEWELLLSEFLVGSICGVLAYMGFKASVLLIFIPNLIISVSCFLMIIFSVFLYFKHKKTPSSR